MSAACGPGVDICQGLVCLFAIKLMASALQALSCGVQGGKLGSFASGRLWSFAGKQLGTLGLPDPFATMLALYDHTPRNTCVVPTGVCSQSLLCTNQTCPDAHAAGQVRREVVHSACEHATGCIMSIHHPSLPFSFVSDHTSRTI